MSGSDRRRCITIAFASVVLSILSLNGCLPGPYSVGEPDSLFSEYTLAWELADQHYGGFCVLTSVDWDSIRTAYREDALAARDWDQVYQVILSMLGTLDDPSVGLVDPQGDIMESTDPGFVNWDLSVWQDYMFQWGLQDSILYAFDFGVLPMFPDSVGYGYVSDLGPLFNYMEFFSSTAELENCSTLVFDLRALSGGSEGNAQLAVGRFVASRELAYWRSYRDGPGRLDMTELDDVDAVRNGAWQFTGPTYVLIGRGTQGIGEIFTLLLASQEHVVLVGDSTAGCSGAWEQFNLVGGWSIFLSNMVTYRPDVTPLPGSGIAPDIFVETTEEDLLAGIDPVLDAALELASGRISP